MLKKKNKNSWPTKTYSTARVYVNCADEFHALRRSVVRRVCTIFLRTWSKKCAIHMPLLFNARSFLHCCMKQRTSGFEKAASRQRKIYIMTKATCYTHACRVASRIFRITSNSSRSARFELTWLTIWSSQLRTYPSPNQTLTLPLYQLTVVGSGEG